MRHGNDVCVMHANCRCLQEYTVPLSCLYIPFSDVPHTKLIVKDFFHSDLIGCEGGLVCTHESLGVAHELMMVATRKVCLQDVI
jgi:hypothetical protein